MKTLLVGPVSVGIFKFANKQIIIMGEFHRKDDCPVDRKNTRYITLKEFIPWYHDCIGNEKIVDIFLESGYSISKNIGWWNTLRKIYYNNVNTWNYGLGYLRNNLDICSRKNDKSLACYFKCPQNTRVHTCDIRFFYEYDTHSTKMCYPCVFKLLWDIQDYETSPTASYKLLEMYEYLEKFLFDKKSFIYHEHLNKKFLKVFKINKQLRNIRSQSVRNKIKKWGENTTRTNLKQFKQQFLLYKKLYRKELVPFPQGFFPVSDECLQAFVEVQFWLMYVLSVYMDMYTMARIFRVFADGTQPENIIVYVGVEHAERYYTFMNMVRAKKILAPITPDYHQSRSCVDITSFYDLCEKQRRKTASSTK